MSKPVLFVTGVGRIPERSENIYTLYNAYAGPKAFTTLSDPHFQDTVHSGKYDLMVIDVFPTASPGKTIMIWHAIQGGKHIGLDEQGTYYKPEYAGLIDLIITAGHGAVPMFSQCTGVPADRMLNLGMPRTDRYIGKKKGDGHTRIAQYRSYLYAPTFRKQDETPMPDIDWKWINDQMHDDELFVVKSHPYTRNLHIPNLPHVMEFSGIEPSVNYLYDCDVLITDYSSIMFDAYLLGKPVVLFEKTPGYTTTRGMYLDYPIQYSSRFAITEEGLIPMIRSAHTLGKIENACVQYVADACDGHSCERILSLINSLNGR